MRRRRTRARIGTVGSSALLTNREESDADAPVIRQVNHPLVYRYTYRSFFFFVKRTCMLYLLDGGFALVQNYCRYTTTAECPLVSVSTCVPVCICICLYVAESVCIRRRLKPMVSLQSKQLGIFTWFTLRVLNETNKNPGRAHRQMPDNN